nr:MAG TPA: hypothetical protein [Caudoviricetes sp.]
MFIIYHLCIFFRYIYYITHFGACQVLLYLFFRFFRKILDFRLNMCYI